MADTARDKAKAVDEVTAIADELRDLAEQAMALEQRLRAVRGTREIQRVQSVTAPNRAPRQPVDMEMHFRIRKMLESEPMRLTQLVEATGLHENKIKVHITKFQREGVHIVNLGAANKALWFIPGPKALKRLEQVENNGDTDEG